MTKKTKCAECEFFDSRISHGTGHCRVNAPVVSPGSNVFGSWPVVNKGDWCGKAVTKESQ